MALVPANELNRVREGARRFAAGFSAGQKATVIVVSAAIILAGVLFMSISGKPSYAILFSGLSASDAVSITNELTTDHVPFQLEDGGTTVLVPENDVAKARLTAAAAGLPAQSTAGLTILDKTGLTTSQLTQQADYLEAIQGELEQTIDAISGVASSQVNIAEAANQTFAIDNTRPTGASVLVTMNAGRTLSAGEVQAIVHLVASSVPGLSSSDVTVADSEGTLLAGPGASAAASTNSQTAAYDASVQSKVEAYLTSVFGTGNADVQVNATLNFDKVSTTAHQIAPPAKGATTSFCTQYQKSSTTYTTGAKVPGGVAGSVVATTAKATAKTGKQNYSQTSTSRTCETSTETQTISQAPGSVVNQSVAVLVNSKAIPRGMKLGTIKKGVAAAANLRPARGDVLSFAAVPFSTAAAAQAAREAKAVASASKRSRMLSELKDASGAIAIALIVLLLWLSSRRRRRGGGAPVVIDHSALQLPAPVLASSAATQPDVPEIGPSNSSAEIERLIDAQAPEMAVVLRNLLHLEDASELGPESEPWRR
ncbi:MAG: flagellar basal-body MS-ring/collar protein FliF [Actinomycetota bacterium]|nr:flagellar basal-body MS-ring/collar protein FliF [Actinomycetota bacterium]